MEAQAMESGTSTDASGWTPLCPLDDVTDGDGLQVKIGDRTLAVWRVDALAFVTDDTCTHGDASLVLTGMLDGFSIVCGLHQGEFDIRTGEVRAAPCSKPIRSYAATVREGVVLARLAE
ncbi:non-heme iron oxygenase ferredoxin subunit [Paraburkholderia sp. MPAMCS5]|uniref:non-heme iron oxygenase ferredoxin subunit n=1 Tax=Paraburkholderia sp. MPAMCS5 TaxID=3112563 RepID=UPI002E19A427|nr:non-heme iron oxygenase ferredoxin subunit [Paraburkholderia sp. MPAMCS5]